MISLFGMILSVHIMASPFFSDLGRRLPSPSIYLPMQQVLLVMRQYSLPIVFLGSGLTGGKNFNITVLEFFPIVLAVGIWRSIMRDRCIVFFSENQAVVEIIKRQTSKDRYVMVLLRHCFIYS